MSGGKVYVLGAGPGDPEVLTVKATRILATADVVLYDGLVSREIVTLAPRRACVASFEKRCGRKTITEDEINALLVASARAGLTAVRLKGGDPLVFGRGGEEIESLARAGVDFETVPGVTAPLAAAASARIPLTHRRLASTLIFVSGHPLASAAETVDDALSAGLPPHATIVVYMPGDLA